MSSNEDLKSKYGRGNTYNNQEKSQVNADTSSNSQESAAKYGRDNTYTKKSKENLTQQQKEIKENIANVISQYTQEHQSFKDQQNRDIKQNKESLFVRITKGIISFCIILTVVCIIIALIAKPQIDAEGELIIEQIKKSEDLYYSKMHKYHYFSKTNYDQTLGVDLSIYKYFTTCEVIPEQESGNYEAKIYGATNAFTMTYYYLKALIFKKQQ